MEEIFKDIPGYKGLYQVSNLGNVKSLKFSKETILKKADNGNGYLGVNLNSKRYYIHRLVLITFIGNSKLDCNHKNGIKGDNRLENLEWCTRSNNLKHAYRKLKVFNRYKNNHPNKGKFGGNNLKAKKVNQYDLNGNFIKTWDCIKEAGDYYKIQGGNISSCCKGRFQSAGGFIWKYGIEKKDINFINL